MATGQRPTRTATCATALSRRSRRSSAGRHGSSRRDIQRHSQIPIRSRRRCGPGISPGPPPSRHDSWLRQRRSPGPDRGAARGGSGLRPPPRGSSWPRSRWWRLGRPRARHQRRSGQCPWRLRSPARSRRRARPRARRPRLRRTGRSGRPATRLERTRAPEHPLPLARKSSDRHGTPPRQGPGRFPREAPRRYQLRHRHPALPGSRRRPPPRLTTRRRRPPRLTTRRRIRHPIRHPTRRRRPRPSPRRIRHPTRRRRPRPSPRRIRHPTRRRRPRPSPRRIRHPTRRRRPTRPLSDRALRWWLAVAPATTATAGSGAGRRARWPAAPRAAACTTGTSASRTR